MDSESQIALLLDQVETSVRELEQTVENFEQAALQAEACLEDREARAYAEGMRAEDELQPLTHALQTGRDAAMAARVANMMLDDALMRTETALSAAASLSDVVPLPPGSLVCGGRYRLVQLLHSRPRVHLYLARGLSNSSRRVDGEAPLVVIREIALMGLTPALRQCVVQAAFAEFAAPLLFGTTHLPGVADRLYLEDDRHYLIMQPRQVRGHTPAIAQLLSERLSGSTRLDLTTALHLGTRLCQTVARLHRLNLFLGELTPAMVLIDRVGGSNWAPLLLAPWSPAPQFWPGFSRQMAQQVGDQIFPSLDPDPERALFEQDEHAFAAPELFAGQRDARSDVYALGAVLYLLCTGSPPVAASQRLRDDRTVKIKVTRAGRQAGRSTRHARRVQTELQPLSQDLALKPPHLLNAQISPLLEQILLRALALKPEERFASVRDLAEALESMHLKVDLPAVPIPLSPFPRAKVSRLRRLFEWLKR